MALLASHPLETTFADPNVKFQTHGANWLSEGYPLGIPERVEIIGSAAKITLLETDVETFGGKRTEMVFSHSLTPTGERWYTWDFMVPSGWDFSTGMAIMQIHETPDGGAPAVAVQFVLMLENNQLVARVPVDVLTPGNESYRLGNHPFEFDRWYSMCFHANWQLTAIGSWELFVDGIPMFRQYGIANAYNFAVGGYLKLGIYDFHDATGWGTKTAYFRNVKVWSDNEGYQTVMGGVPVSPTRIQQL